MSSLMVSNLEIMMLEFAVQKLFVPKTSIFDSVILKKTTVMFRMLDYDWTGLSPHRKDHVPYRGSNLEEENFHGGKSIVFAMPSESLEKKITGVDIQVHVRKEVSKYFEMDPCQNVGLAFVNVDKLFNGIVKELRERKELEEYLSCFHKRQPISRSLKGTYRIMDEEQRITGATITVYARLSHFGKSIVTEIERCHGQQRDFYAQEETNETFPYQCRELRVWQLEGGCWGSETILPPLNPGQLECHCDTWEPIVQVDEKWEESEDEARKSQLDYNVPLTLENKETHDLRKQSKRRKSSKKRRRSPKGKKEPKGDSGFRAGTEKVEGGKSGKRGKKKKKDDKIPRESNNEDGGKARPVTQNGGKVRPVTEDGSKVRPVTEDGSKVRPATEDGSKVRPVTEDGSKVRPVTEDGSKVKTMTQDGNKVRVITQDGSKEKSLTGHAKKEGKGNGHRKTVMMERTDYRGSNEKAGTPVDGQGIKVQDNDKTMERIPRNEDAARNKRKTAVASGRRGSGPGKKMENKPDDVPSGRSPSNDTKHRPVQLRKRGYGTVTVGLRDKERKPCHDPCGSATPNAVQPAICPNFYAPPHCCYQPIALCKPSIFLPIGCSLDTRYDQSYCSYGSPGVINIPEITIITN